MRRARSIDRELRFAQVPIVLILAACSGGGDGGLRADAGLGAADASVSEDARAAIDASVSVDVGAADASVSEDARADTSPPRADAGGTTITCQPAAFIDGRPVHGNAPPLVREDPACGLTYGRYAARGSTAADQLVPDFSYAGYEGGGVAIPTVAGPVVALSPASGDNRARIQAALDTAASQPRGADGFRGVVVLAPGTYEVDGTLFLRASGVVLRGAGQSPTGTTIVATRAAQHELIVAENSLFGPTTTTAGLLVGADIRRVLADRHDLDVALIPAESINDDGLFLDDDPFEAVRAALPMPVHPSYDFLDALVPLGDAALTPLA